MNSMNSLLVDLRLLEQILSRLFHSLLAPEEQLSHDAPYQGKLAEFPHADSVNARAEWFLCKFDLDDMRPTQMIDTMSKRKQHEFFELLAQLAKGIYIMADIHYGEKTCFAIQDISAGGAALGQVTIHAETALQNFHKPEYNRSSKTHLEIEGLNTSGPEPAPSGSQGTSEHITSWGTDLGQKTGTDKSNKAPSTTPTDKSGDGKESQAGPTGEATTHNPRKRPPPSNEPESGALKQQKAGPAHGTKKPVAGQKATELDKSIKKNLPQYQRSQPPDPSREERVKLCKVSWGFSKVVPRMETVHAQPKPQANGKKEYMTVQCEVPKVPEQDHDFELFKAVHDLAVESQDNLPNDYHPALHLTSPEVKSLGHDGLAALFKNHGLSLFETDDGKISLEKIVDPHMQVEVHDLAGSSLEDGQEQATSQICTVKEVFEHINSENGQVINLLDLPDSTGTCAQPLAAVHLDSDQFAVNSTEQIEGGGGAVTRDHVDAAGKCTFVGVKGGPSKLWLMCLGSKDPAMQGFTNTHPWLSDPCAHTKAKDISWVREYYWQIIHLPKGSTLIMQPYTVHIVLTLGPTICHGGHFYLAPTMTCTMYAKRLEHVYPKGLANEAHTGSWFGIHRMMIYASWKILHCQAPSPYSNSTLATLILMCQHSGTFSNSAEQLPADALGYEWQVKKAQQAAQERLKDWEDDLYEWWDPVAQEYAVDVFDEEEDDELESEDRADDVKGVGSSA
ncbi:hypothetical protein FRC07_010548 [Ceratobasidium sp. 392]|nr:hypothetical protein FRC07_010548 [Ceratobasidium sp. 392]